MPVSVGPGHTTLTVIASAASSSAAPLARLIAAALAVLYGHILGSALMPDVEAVTTMRPPPRRRSAGTAARIPSNTPRTLTSRTRSKTSMGKVRMSPLAGSPAFRIMASSPPNSPSANATASSLVAASVTSPPTARTRGCCSTARKASLGRSTTTTDSPAASKASTVARPIPEAPPVTIETRVLFI